MASTPPVVPNRLSGEAAPNTLSGFGPLRSTGLASAPAGGLMAAIPHVSAVRPGRGLILAVAVGAIGALVALLLLAPA